MPPPSSEAVPPMTALTTVPLKGSSPFVIGSAICENAALNAPGPHLPPPAALVTQPTTAWTVTPIAGESP